MADATQRTNLGPSITVTSRKDPNVKIASENQFVEDEQGIRRLVAAGSPVPAYLGLGDVKTEDVEAREFTRVFVDEEASKPQHERQGYDAPSADDGTSTENVERAVKKSRSSGSGSRQTASGADNRE